jgi:hypothetical protein
VILSIALQRLLKGSGGLLISLMQLSLYHDPEVSKYYLNTSSEIDGPRLKRIFGNRNLSIKVNDVIYTFAPESFSQVNLSICSEMLIQQKGF